MHPLRPDPADTRDRILAAAGQVFARKGYRAASLDEVAQAAGMTKGAIYWHFRSKSDLFFALLDHKFQQHTAPVSDELRLAIAAASGDPRRALTALLQAAFARLRADSDWPRLYLEFIGQARDDDMRERLAHFHAGSIAVIADYIRTMQDAGIGSARHDASMLAAFWSAMFDGLLLAWIINPNDDHDALVARIVDMLWQGIAPPESPAPRT